jgi:poly-gamma-glutamate system protein
VAIVCGFIMRTYGYEEAERTDSRSMRQAAVLTERWYGIITEEKEKRGIHPPPGIGGAYASLLGDEYSVITTTLGSVESKTAAANPEFGALAVRLLHDAGIDSASTVGITMSGSFPSLSIAVLAACQTIGCRVVMVSSLGASTFGANQPGATWIDQETWLREYGGLHYSSEYVSLGAEGDTGGGLPEEGITEMKDAARRTGARLVVPSGLLDAIQHRISFFLSNRISLLINIGGSQTSLGGCVHAVSIPNGMLAVGTACSDSDRGVVVRMLEQKVPVLELLNIRDLAAKNGLSLSPDTLVRDSILYKDKRARYWPPLLSLVTLAAALFFAMRQSPKRKNESGKAGLV